MEINEFKVVFLGDSGVGTKTSLIKRIVHNSNISATSVASFVSKTIQTKLGKISLQLWDTAGQEKYRALDALFIKGAHCIILGYDVTRKESFESIRDFWYNFAKEKTERDNVLIYLVGNKIDLDDLRKVENEEGKSLANDLNMKYFGVSAKTGENVDILFDDIVNSLIKKYPIDKIDVKKREKKDNIKELKIPKKDDKIKSKENKFDENVIDNKKFKMNLNKYLNF